ncbi:ABC transporter permease [bacterium]|nr:ABC transporter permease [bacterium]
MIRDFIFFFSEAIISIRRSGLMIAISIATISVSLVIFGIFLLISANISNLSSFFSSKLEVRVYLKDSVSSDESKALQTQFEAMPSVRKVTFISRDEAWKTFQKSFPTIKLGNILSDNPLPHSFRLTVSDTEQIPPLVTRIRALPQVDHVSEMGEYAHRIATFSKYTRIAGILLVSLLTMATLLIIVNTIRLTVIARQDEISIMQLVGATVSFIRWPFIIEGLIIGIIGAIIAISFVSFGYSLLVVKFQESVPFVPMLYDSVTLNMIRLTVFALGTILGVFGAYLSVSKTVKQY